MKQKKEVFIIINRAESWIIAKAWLWLAPDTLVVQIFPEDIILEWLSVTHNEARMEEKAKYCTEESNT